MMRNPVTTKSLHISTMNWRDTFYYWYFILHIPITILIDSCLVFPRDSRHWVQNMIVDFHVHFNRDFLLKSPPLWLHVFGIFEVYFQLPVFFIAAWLLRRGSKTVYLLMTIYGFNAFFTTVVCLTYVMAKSEAHGLSNEDKMNLFSLYLPYVVLPGFMMVDCGLRCMSLITVADQAIKAKEKELEQLAEEPAVDSTKDVEESAVVGGAVEGEEVEDVIEVDVIEVDVIEMEGDDDEEDEGEEEDEDDDDDDDDDEEEKAEETIRKRK